MTQVTSGAFSIVIAAGTDPYISMPTGVWTELPKNGGTAPNQGIFAFSNTAWDQTNQRVLIFGGGDQDYWGNDVWEYRTTSQAFVQHYTPDDMQGSVGIAALVSGTDPDRPGMWVPSGRPITRHDTGKIYMTHRHEMTIGGSAPYYSSGTSGYVYIGSSTTTGKSEQLPPGVSWTGSPPTNNGVFFVNPGDLWHYHVDNKVWSYKGSCRLNGGTTRNVVTGYYDPNGPIQNIIGGVYDPANQVVWCLTTIEARYYGYTPPQQYEERYHTRFSKYNPDTGVFTNYASPSTWSEYLDRELFAFDAGRGKVYFLAVQGSSIKLSSWDTTTNTWTDDIPFTDTPQVYADCAVTYASGPDKIIYANPYGMWGLSMTTKVWARIADTFADQNGGAIFGGKLHYDSARNMLFMCTKRNDIPRAYGYKF